MEHSEDCLYLNIWSPTEKALFPVYVWIHGGGFTGGHAFESMYDGSEITQEGVLCISVAYRLGVFGFFSISRRCWEQTMPAAPTMHYAT